MLTNLIQRVSERKGWTPYAIEVMPDHIHLFIGTKDPRENILGILKGESSSFLQHCFPILKEALPKGSLWSRSYFISSIGNIVKAL